MRELIQSIHYALRGLLSQLTAQDAGRGMMEFEQYIRLRRKEHAVNTVDDDTPEISGCDVNVYHIHVFISETEIAQSTLFPRSTCSMLTRKRDGTDCGQS
jgi:hypothetical protein